MGFSVVRSLTARTATLGFLEYSSNDPAVKKRKIGSIHRQLGKQKRPEPSPA